MEFNDLNIMITIIFVLTLVLFGMFFGRLLFSLYNNTCKHTIKHGRSEDDVKTTITLDVSKPKRIQDYVFPELLIERYTKERNISEDNCELVQTALKDWFEIFVGSTNRTQFYDFPSKEVDELWHMFILFTKDYREFCHEYIGQFLDHTPLRIDQLDKSEPDLNNLMATFEKVKDKHNGLLFKIDDLVGINNKFNYSFMSDLYYRMNKFSKTSEDAITLNKYRLIPYVEYDRIVNPKPEKPASVSKPSRSSSSNYSSSKSSDYNRSKYDDDDDLVATSIVLANTVSTLSCGSSSSDSSSTSKSSSSCSSSCGSSCGSSSSCGS